MRCLNSVLAEVQRAKNGDRQPFSPNRKLYALNTAEERKRCQSPIFVRTVNFATGCYATGFWLVRFRHSMFACFFEIKMI